MGFKGGVISGLGLDLNREYVISLSMVNQMKQQGGEVEVQISPAQYAVACDCISCLIGRFPKYAGVDVCWRNVDVKKGMGVVPPEQAYGLLFGDLMMVLKEKLATDAELSVLYNLSPSAKIELFTSIDLMKALMQADKFSPNLLKVFSVLIGEGSNHQVEEISFNSFLEEGGDEGSGDEEPTRVAVTQMMVLSDINAEVDGVRSYMGTEILHSSEAEEALVGLDLIDTQGGEELGKGAARALANGDIELDDGTFGTGMYGEDGNPSLQEVLKQEVLEDGATQAPDKPSDTSLPSTLRRNGLQQWLGRLLKKFPWSSEK
jgi:hypothetical protein